MNASIRQLFVSIPLITICLNFAAIASAAEISWESDLRAARDRAERENKLLLLHFYSDQCVWCDRLEAGAFRDPSVVEAIAKNYVAVKIHAGQNPNVARTFRITGYPTDVIVTPQGAALSHRTSPQAANRFVEMLADNAATLQSTPPAGPAAEATAIAAAPTAAAQAAQAEPADAPSATGNPSSAGSPVAAAAAPPTNAPAPPATAVAAVPAVAMPDPTTTAAPTPGANLVSATLSPSDLTMPTATPATEASLASDPSSLAQSPRSAPQTAQPVSPNAEPTQQVAEQRAQVAGSPTSQHDLARHQHAQHQLALDGYCPVSLLDSDKWAEGKPEFGVIHLGQLYLFADGESMKKFLDDPEPYTPVLNGIDVVRFFEEKRIVPGKRDFGARDPEHNRMFFFADEAAMLHFESHHTRYTEAAIAVTRQAVADANPRR
jgi:protein disulfide-isomerase